MSIWHGSERQEEICSVLWETTHRVNPREHWPHLRDLTGLQAPSEIGRELKQGMEVLFLVR